MTKRSFMSPLRFRLLMVSLLVRLGLAQSVPEPAQCLASGIYNLTRLPDHQDPSSCWTDCSAEADCHVAVVLRPLSGSDQCLLVNCLNQGKYSYRRRPSAQIIYLKSSDAAVQCFCSTDQRDNNFYCVNEEDKKPFQSHKVMIFSNYSGFPRFLYNRFSLRCEFFYSGSSSGRNVFETQEGCEALCSEKFRCYRPLQYGRCNVSMPKFFYNMSSQQCEEFVFSGCESNGNMFDTVEECERLCGDVKAATTSPPAEFTASTTSPPSEDPAALIVQLVVSISLLVAGVGIIVWYKVSRHPSSISYRQVLPADPEEPELTPVDGGET